MKIIKYRQYPELNRLRMMGRRGIFALIVWVPLSIFSLFMVPQEYGFISSKGLIVMLLFFLPWVIFSRFLFPRRKWLWKTLLAVLAVYTLVVAFRCKVTTKK